MKILSIGTHLFASTWRELGHAVCAVIDYDLTPCHPDNHRLDFFANPRECATKIRSLIDSFRPDALFQGDRSTPLIHWGIENYSLPKVWYAIDTHLHHAWHRHYAAAFDTVFLAQAKMLPVVQTYARNVLRLPLFCQRATDFVPWSERTVPVSFVGTMNPATNPDRVRFFEQLSPLLSLEGTALHLTTGNYAPVYSTSTIAVNQSVADDLNLRFFEATGCGALLVTDRLSYPVDEILEEGVDFLAYEHGNARDCADKIRWALAHPVEAEAMARSAHVKIRSGHMVRHRALRVIEEIGSLVEKGRQVSAGDPSNATAHLAWTHYFCSQLDLPQRLKEVFADLSGELSSRCRESPDSRPWALLISAGLALDKGDLSLTNLLLMELEPLLLRDDDCIAGYYTLQIKLFSLEGKRADARSVLAKALREFPGEKIFEELRRIMEKL